MINIGGLEWGTAAQIAARLGGDVTEDMVYRWRERDGLNVIKVGRTAYSPMAEAARIERNKRISGKGRRRCVDNPQV